MSDLDSDESAFGGHLSLVTRRGERVRLDVSASELAIVVCRPDGAMLARRAIPKPAAGFGGHELLLSEDERFLVLWLYSGQSEVGYEVFGFGPALDHVASFPYVFGEGSGPVFSSDGTTLAFAWATNPGLTAEEAEIDDAGRLVAPSVVPWANVRIHDLVSGESSTCVIDVLLPAGAPFETDDTHYVGALGIDDGGVRFTMGSGVARRLERPLAAKVVLEAP